MKLKDIANMEYYLENDCYCPGEIYDITGFFYQVFDKNDDCVKLGEKRSKMDENTKVVCVICKTQIINFWIDNENRITSAERYDATENNIKSMEHWLNSQDVVSIELDEFNKGETPESLNDILEHANAIMLN